MQTMRQVIVQRGTWPQAQSVYIHNGSSWINMNVGPGQADLILTNQSSMTSNPSYIVGGFVNNVTVPAIPGAYTEGEVPKKTLNLAYAPSYAATNDGPITQIPAICDPCQYIYTYQPATTSGSTTFIQTPPIYIKYVGTGEGGGVMIDNGNLPDGDDDGIPDIDDPDDDNDGRPDGSDAFPNNPDERDDTDGDGIGNNADPDDDNDGRPDAEDGAPYDPDVQDPDADGDGVPDQFDRFPNNPRESGDADKDGIGDNQDPDDNSASGSGGGSAEGGAAGEGDGDGNPGTGDGTGNPGPKPRPGDTSDQVGHAGTGDTAGEVKPGPGTDWAAAGNGLGGLIPGKIGQFNPVGDTAVPKISVYEATLNFGILGTQQLRIDFGSQPWPMVRALFFCILTYNVACGVVRQLKI